MLGALFTTGCANMMLFFATQSFSGWMVESMIRVASDTVFVTSMRGCLSDVLKGPELTVSAARVATYAGIGVCLGPILASRVIMPLISRRYTFVMNACREIVILSPICLLSVSLTQKVSDTKIWATGHACRAVRSAGWKGVLGAYPDHGDFEMPHWQFHELPGDVLADAAREWVATANVGMLGGCCGIGPEHIRALAAVCRESRAAA